MKLHKHFPPYLAQLVFMNKDGIIKKITSLDYDLFLWLIYNTHKQYSKDSSLYFEFTYKDVKDSFSKSMNTDKIKSSLKKLGELTLYCNILQSYADKEKIRIKPFEIEIITATNNISYGFSVKTSQEFMEWFNNPSPKVDVNYDIIYNLKPTMSKLLYLFLRDSYGGYTNTKRYRNVDIHRLRHMMNVYNEKTTNSNFITELKKSVKTINQYSDLTVKFKVDKKRNLRSGVSEITGVKFTIEWDENKLFEMRLKDRKLEKESNSIDETKCDEVSPDIVSEYSFEDFLTNRIEEEYEINLSYGVEIKKSVESYKNGIRRKLLKDGIKSIFEFLCIIEDEKEILRESIKDTQPYMIVFKNGENPYENYYVNNDCLFVKRYDDTIVTQTVDESIEFIDENRMKLHFDIVRCDSSNKYNKGRF